MINRLTQEVLGHNKMTLKEYLENAQVDVKELDEDLIRVFGFSGLDDVVLFDNRDAAKKLVARLYDDIKKKILIDKKMAVQYLEQEGLTKFDKVNVMDIGWGGSIQEAISKLLDKDVVGYYFGTIDLDKKDAFSNMFGYYFDLDKPSLNKEKVFSNIMMYELIFSAPHGTNIGYKEENGNVVPIFSNNIHYNEVVEKFQLAALNIIDTYFKYISYFDNLSKDFCLQNYHDFLEKPKYEDLEHFSKLSNEFILGSDRQFSYVNKVSMKEIRECPKDFYEKVNKSLWSNTFYIEDAEDKVKDYLDAKRIYNKVKYFDDSLEPLKCAKVYLDFGNGFSEENIIFVPYEHEGVFVKFKLVIDSDVKNIRIDPLEGLPLKIKNLVINTDQGNAKVIIPHKDYLRGKIEKCIWIKSKDPRIILKDTAKLSWITFSAIIEF